MTTDQKQQKCVQMLSERSAEGETLEAVIRSAYSQGYYDGIVRSFTVGTKYEEPKGPMGETVERVERHIETDNEAAMKNLDRWMQTRGGCFRGEYD